MFEEVFRSNMVQRSPGWENEFLQQNEKPLQEAFEEIYRQHSFQADGGRTEEEWAKEFEAIKQSVVSGKGKEPLTADDVAQRASWEDEFNKEQEGVEKKDSWFERFDDVWKTLNGEGKVLDDDELGGLSVEQWENEFKDLWSKNDFTAEPVDPDPVTGPLADYTFEEDNPFLQHPDPMVEGLRLVGEGGSLSAAALAFEAAVQRDPHNSDAWMHLGTVQAENEKEEPAIAALQRSVQENPKNLKALMVGIFSPRVKPSFARVDLGINPDVVLFTPKGLAVSYTNEGQDLQAYATLERWINAQYPSIASQIPEPSKPIDFHHPYQAAQDMHERVTSLFLEAARQGPIKAETTLDVESVTEAATIDPDVQVGLGVLFYNSNDYDKAIDCFTAALSVRPNDYKLWNRLGATLANSGRSEEAIDAYYKALEIKPSFVRGRYNLGVSCINVKCYKEAAEHLLGALSMHVVNVGGNGGNGDNLHERKVSQNLWETLRRTFVLMDRRDLSDKALVSQDVNSFRDEFEF
ncbi:Peroxisomal membrane signal receptor PTS1 [Quaeritorhiza haematococci]|nr:Peroxisomal membrane signal receptor PTS1 [Quaeritorhiza haematococci]